MYFQTNIRSPADLDGQTSFLRGMLCRLPIFAAIIAKCFTNLRLGKWWRMKCHFLHISCTKKKILIGKILFSTLCFCHFYNRRTGFPKKQASQLSILMPVQESFGPSVSMSNLLKSVLNLTVEILLRCFLPTSRHTKQNKKRKTKALWLHIWNSKSNFSKKCFFYPLAMTINYLPPPPFFALFLHNFHVQRAQGHRQSIWGPVA